MWAYATGDTGHAIDYAHGRQAATLRALPPGRAVSILERRWPSLKTALGFEAVGSHSGPDQTGRCLSSKTELHRWKRTTATSESS